MKRNLKILIGVVAVVALAATAVFANSRKQIDSHSTMKTVVYQTLPQPVAAAAAYKAATALSALTVGTSVAMTTVLDPGLGGRNIILTFVDADTDSSLAITCTGLDQWNRQIAERIPASGSFATSTALTKAGTKIFTKINECTPQAIVVGDAAIDTVAIGTGNKVGLPFQFSTDLHEIQTAALYVAANTQTIKTVNATNFDATNFAINEALFSASAVVAGDHVGIVYYSDFNTPDNIDYPSR